MGTPVIVGAVRTAIGRSFKGTLVNTPPETLITAVLPEVVRRSGVDPSAIGDIIFAESHYGGGDLARCAATATGLEHVPGQSVNRHCAGSLTAIGNAAAQIGSGMERVLIAGGVQSLSMTPLTNFSVDEHPRRDTTVGKLAGLKVLHPEIEGFSITAGNSSGTNDAAAAVALVDSDYAAAENLKVMATIKAWGAAGVPPRDCGLGALAVIDKVLKRAGLSVGDVSLWEINEAFASVPIAACKQFGIDEEKVNFSGSGCSLGHPIAASGARMVTTLAYELARRGGGIGVAAMCAGGGQGGAVVIEI